MKQCLFWLVGLMSLLSLSSCDDKILYDGEANFRPEQYSAKMIVSENETVDKDWVATTLLIYGQRDLVFAEIEKSDWRIITKDGLSLNGKTPLELYMDEPILLRNYNSEILQIESNYGCIDCVLDNYMVTYNYLGQDVVLQPKDGLRLTVRVEEFNRYNEQYFFQNGYIVFTLSVAYVPVKIHKIPFTIIDKDRVKNINL